MSAETDELRALFAERMKPEHVTIAEIYRLWCILERCLREDHGHRLLMEMEPLNDKVMLAIRNHGWPKRGVELRVRGPYFDRREAVTFGTSGFIGFCGWASSCNERPFLDGFREWCETFRTICSGEAGEGCNTNDSERSW